MQVFAFNLLQPIDGVFYEDCKIFVFDFGRRRSDQLGTLGTFSI